MLESFPILSQVRDRKILELFNEIFYVFLMDLILLEFVDVHELSVNLSRLIGFALPRSEDKD